MRNPILSLRDFGKSFGGVRAVADVDLDLEAGEIHGLVGANGAGKSSLLRCLSGAEEADEGQILIDGEPVQIRNPRDARELGIETVYQDLALADHLDAVANLFLGREPTRFGLLDEPKMEREARLAIARIHHELGTHGDLRRPVRELSGGQRQAVAMARAVHFQARVFLLDEPTAALGPGETEAVLDLLRHLRDEGVAILVVSHDLRELLRLADRISVMKGGHRVHTTRAGGSTPEELLGHMLLSEEEAAG